MNAILEQDPMKRPREPHRYGPWVYVHIPRTGGTSLQRYLGAVPGVHYFGHTPVHAHVSLLGPGRWAELLTFATIRSPYDRAVSLFHYFYGDRTTLLKDEELIAGFQQWVLGGLPTDGCRYPEIITYWTPDGPQEISVKANQFEYLQYRGELAIWKVFSLQHEVPWPIRQLMGNPQNRWEQSNRRDLTTKDYFGTSNRCREMIMDLYAPDFRLWGASDRW